SGARRPYCADCLYTAQYAASPLLRPTASRAVPLDQLAGDDDALHLVGALADHQQRRVAVEPLDRKLLGIAVAAVDAHRLDAVLERGLGGGELGHAGFHVAALAPVVRARGTLGEQARGLEPRRHVGELELDRLMLADRLAEGFAHLRIGDRLLERR